MELSSYLVPFIFMFLTGVVFWLISVIRKDVSIVDSLWSLFFIIAATTTYMLQAEVSLRASIVLVLVYIWAIRLSLYITVRHWGHAEDHRYQTIRENNNPGFAFKSLYLIFTFQAVVALIVAMPLFYSMESQAELTLFDAIGIILWCVGMFFETVSDYQLYKFKQQPQNAGKILTTGLWKYTRHPNYFGECIIWWGYFSFALSAGGIISIISPLLMTFLLLKFSGVHLLEQTLKTRPGYEAYMKNTNAFLPWFVTNNSESSAQDAQ